MEEFTGEIQKAQGGVFLCPSAEGTAFIKPEVDKIEKFGKIRQEQAPG
jgi:hypothetical protein